MRLSARPTLPEVIDQLVAEQLLTDEQARGLTMPPEPTTSWAIRRLIGLGAWLAACCLIGFMWLAQLLRSYPTIVVEGLLFCAAALALARFGRSSFQRQFALALSFAGQILAISGVALWAGKLLPTALFALPLLVAMFALFDDGIERSAVTVGIAGTLYALLVHAELHFAHDVITLGGALLAVELWMSHPRWACDRRASVLEPIAHGALAVMIAGLAAGFFEPVTRNLALLWPTTLGLGALLLRLVLSIRLGDQQRLPARARWVCAALVPLFVVATWRAPGILGALVVVLLGQSRRQRPLQATGWLLLAAFLFGFYYQLQITLLMKSGLLAASGALLLGGRALAGWGLAAWDRKTAGGAGEPATLPRWATARRLGVWFGLTLVLLVSNALVLSKERLLSGGTEMLLELAPRDPRSLMQGDYMRLDYAIARQLREPAETLPPDGALVVTLDHQRVARFVRVFRQGQQLAPGQQLLRYRVRRRQLRLGPNAYFFQEGLAKRFARARYGELRVSPTGEAVLTALRDDHHRRLP